MRGQTNPNLSSLTPPKGEDTKRNRRAKHTFKWVVNQLNTDDLKILVNAKKEEEEEEKRTEEQRKKRAEEERREMVKAIRTEAALFLAEMVSICLKCLDGRRRLRVHFFACFTY